MDHEVDQSGDELESPNVLEAGCPTREAAKRYARKRSDSLSKTSR